MTDNLYRIKPLVFRSEPVYQLETWVADSPCGQYRVELWKNGTWHWALHETSSGIPKRFAAGSITGAMEACQCDYDSLMAQGLEEVDLDTPQEQG